MLKLYNLSVLLICVSALVVFILLFFISAPYGKFLRKGWGPSIRSKCAWLGMEFPSAALIIILYILNGNRTLTTGIFLACWLSHYLYRTFIYPFRQSGKDKPYPLVLAGMAFIFNLFNGFANGYGIFHINEYAGSWLLSWKFIAGSLIFISGWIINKTADEKLRALRKENKGEYNIPRGWLFSYISSPHYFGEIIEWGGWAVMTWSLPGLAFFIFTFANLFPRAISSHKWYKKHFPQYPVTRKAIIPFLV